MRADTITAEPASNPFSREAEQSVLGCLLLDSDVRVSIADVGLREADFFESRHRAIWRAVVAVSATGAAADVVTVFDWLQGAGEDVEIDYLHALSVCVPSPRGMADYAAIVREHSAQRALMATLDSALAVAGGQGAVVDKMDRVAGMLQALIQTQMPRTPRRLYEVAVERSGHYQAVADGTVVPGWPTGIGALDTALSGGFRAGGLYILAARPSVGKSSLALSMAVSIARQGLPTLLLSQEMTAGEVADRAIASQGLVDYGRMLSGRMDDNTWGRVVNGLGSLKDLPIHVDDQPSLRLSDVRAKARSLPGVRLIVVDYLQLCSSDLRDANRNAQVEEISRGLKALAKDLGCAVLALSQLNRQVELRANKRPSLGDLRDSGAIEQDADAVLMLWPVREFKSEGRKVIGMAVEKNRQGRFLEVGLDFWGATQSWYESTADINPPMAPMGNRRHEVYE